MSRTRGENSDLIVPANFLAAIRESGYVSLSTALAELIDNSLQAGATLINVTIARDEAGGLPRVAVEDDGAGMSRAQIGACLRFGGSSRFSSRASFGRFGMGLPAASLSQARHVEVTAWGSPDGPLSVALDADAITRGQRADFTPRPGRPGESASGCRVVWSRCDRIEYRRLGWLEKALRKDLGRMFRRFLGCGVSVMVNGAAVEAVDPLLLSTRINGASAQIAFEPLRYELMSSAGGTGFVTVRFSALPVADWHRLDNTAKRRAGIVGGGGVSILRAGREIAHGWHLMGGKRKENYDDWWRCEIEFEPVLDEHFGITMNKQGVRPSAALREALEPDLEQIARLLYARTRRAFEEVKFQQTVQASCRIAAAADPDLPVVPTPGHAAGALDYCLEARQLSGESMLDLTLKHRRLDVTLNTDHPGYAALYQSLNDLGEAGVPARTALELLLLSLARTVAASGVHEQEFRDLLHTWGAVYGRMLQRA